MVLVGKVVLQPNLKQEKVVKEVEQVKEKKMVVVDKVDIYDMFHVKKNEIIYLEIENFEVEVVCKGV